MTEDSIHPPDQVREDRLAAHRAAQHPGVTVDKPIAFRIRVRPATVHKHYPRKPRKRSKFDPRKVHFF